MICSGKKNNSSNIDHSVCVYIYICMEIHTKGTQDVSQVKEPRYHPSYAADPWAVAHRGRGENFSCIGNYFCLNLMIQGSLEVKIGQKMCACLWIYLQIYQGTPESHD